jgi:hypothetical protein
MKLAAYIILIASFSLGLNGLATADIITDWNERAVTAGYTARVTPGVSARNIAMVHIAMFEALNSIEPRYTPYRKQLTAAPGLSHEAAAAAAAHHILVREYPAQAKELDKALEASLAAVSDEQAKMDGIRLGEEAARAIRLERSTDSADAPNTYRPYTTAGKYVPTDFPVMSSWGAVRPFGLKTAGQFRPAAPYALTSTQMGKGLRRS